MESEPFVYLNGSFIPKSEAKISVFDHGLLYGDGVFEGIREYDGYVFQLKEHIDRLYESANYIELKIPLGKKQMAEALLQTLRKNSLKNAYIRLVITRGTGDLGVNPTLCKEPNVFIITVPVKVSEPSTQPRVVTAAISVVRRDSVDATSHEVKSLNYLNSVLAALEATHAGVEVPIMLDSRGYVSEGSTMNIFLVKRGIIYTPASSAAILHGITRERIIRLSKESGYSILEKDVTPFELASADEVFLTGTLSEMVSVGSIGGKTVGSGAPGPFTKKLFKEFTRLTRSPHEGAAVYEVQRLERPYRRARRAGR